VNLQHKLFVPLLLIVTLPILAMGVGAYTYILDSTKQALINDVDSVSKSLRPTINERIKTAESNLRLVTSSRLIQDYIARDEQRYTVFQPSLIRQLSEYQGIYPEYFAMKLILENGEIDTSVDTRVDAELEFDASEWHFYQELIKKNDTNIRALIERSEHAGQFIISLGLQLNFKSKLNELYARGKVERTFFTFSLYLDYIQTVIEDVNYTQENLIIVTDPADRIIFNNGQFNFSQLEARLKIIDTDDGFHLLNKDKNPFYLSSVELLHGMKLNVAVPVSKFTQSANKLALNTGLWLTGIIIIIFVLSLAYIRRLLLTPIYAIKNLVSDITNGLMDSPILLRSKKDELGALTESIIEMRSKINDNNQRIESLAYNDELTSLPNRYSFQVKLDSLTSFAEKSSIKFAVIFLDLDNFKAVNDTLGHDTGDKLLIEASERIEQSFGIDNSDKALLKNKNKPMLARLGGDEFTILLPFENEITSINDHCKNLIEILSTPFLIDGHEIKVGASVGIALYPRDGLQRKELLKNADIAMYESKNLGKNCFTFFNEKMKQKADERQLIETSLLKAISECEFSLEFQPRIKIDDYTIEGFEALIRWDNKAIGRVPPDKFIPIAESNLQILDIGRWVLNAACIKIRKWIDMGYEDFRLSINVSAVQLHHANLVKEIEVALAINNISGNYLEIEITESAILEDEALAISKLENIKQLGVRIALDDFGTGYSSLSQLRMLPIDILKIDQSFMTNITQDKYVADVFEGIIQLAKRLRLTTVAEGVERASQHEVLLVSKCDHAQGYYYAKPLPESMADEYVRDSLTKQTVTSVSHQFIPTPLVDKQ